MNSDYFPGRLRELREAAGLTQQALADKAGLTQRGVAQLEQGRRKPAWETVLALANALDVPCDVFREKPASVPKPKRGRPRKETP